VLTMMTLGTLAGLSGVSNAAPAGRSDGQPGGRTDRQPAPSSQGEGARGIGHAFLGPELDAAWPLPLTGSDSDGSAMGIFGHLVDAYFADPCTHPDTAANGAWKALHPPGQRTTTRFTAIQTQQTEEAISWLEASALPADSAAQRALADTWASAHSSRNGWSAFSSQSTHIDQLADRQAVEHRLCATLIDGKSPLLRFDSVLGQFVLDVELSLPPSSSERVYELEAITPEAAAHIAAVSDLLAASGLPPAAGSSAAAACHAMEKAVHQATMTLFRLDLAGAQRHVPAFPWATLWSRLGLNPSTALNINTGMFHVLGDLLDTRPVEDWKGFLRYQEALLAQAYIDPKDHSALLGQLDQLGIGDTALSALYTQHFAPARGQLAKDMLSDIVAQFTADIRSSALGQADQDLLRTTLGSLALNMGDAGSGRSWAGTAANATFLHNMQALRAAELSNDVQALVQGRAIAPLTQPTHRLAAFVSCRTGDVILTRATINGVLDTFGDSLEGRWATLGSMLGHEVAHCLTEVNGLSAEALALFEQRGQAVQQRIENTPFSGPALNASRIAEEAACDLSGLATARRAGQMQASLQGRSFDDALFFHRAAQLHAANPTPSQRSRLSTGMHPPPETRASLVREVAGFEAAHTCDPSPRAPFNRVL